MTIQVANIKRANDSGFKGSSADSSVTTNSSVTGTKAASADSSESTLMSTSDVRKIMREVESAAGCSNPVRVRSDLVNLQTGEVSTRSLRLACKDRRSVICPSCSATYQKDAWILVSTGLVGGKGLPEAVGAHPRLFVTLTAPSFGPVHTITSRGTCRPYGPSARCPHQRSLLCHRRHPVDDPLLGRPLCFECFDYVSAVLWNAHCSRLWNNTVQLTRRSLAQVGGVPMRALNEVARIHYLKIAEIQRRGLIHFHVILRADGPKGPSSELPEWLTLDVLATTLRDVVVRVEATRRDGRTVRWGEVFDIQPLAYGLEDAGKVASYIAKYSTKTTDGSLEMARQFRSRKQIRTLIDDPHIRQMALTSWDLSQLE